MSQVSSPRQKCSWAGRIVSAVTVLFLLFDAIVKILKLPVAVEGTTKLGYPAGLVVTIGITQFICILTYITPQTSILGAILLTGYLDGATATQARVENPWFVFPIVIGVLAWAGLFLRNARLRALIPLQR